MPNTNVQPFARLAVDHLIQGGSRVWWRMDRTFNDPGPHTFQLQVGTTGLADGRDWRNVGTSFVDAYYAVDDEQRLRGKTLLTHYRVTLTTPLGHYVSPAVSCEGELTEKNLLLAREIIRKEQLRGRGLAYRQGVILKRLRYGPVCTVCKDAMTAETTDSDCPECNGTGRQFGFHPASPLCVEFVTQKSSNETVDPSRGSINDVPVKLRLLGFPMLNKSDVWVDGRSDERWIVESVKYESVIQGVPIVITADVNLLPYSHRAYSISVTCGGTAPELPGAGTGCASVDHDYDGTDSLRYVDAEGQPIAGADVLLYRAADFTAVQTLPTDDKIVAATTTGSDGRWVTPLLVDPGEYVLVLRKTGSFGPDVTALTVTRPETSVASQQAGSFWDQL